MSAVKKSAKISLYLLGLFVLLVVGAGVYIYMNMDFLAKSYSEKVASEALGVPVTIGNMKILLDQKKVIVSDIAVANPKGFSDGNSITIKNISVAGESFSKDKLVFALISVDGTVVNLEVNDSGANLGALKKETDKMSGDAVAQTEPKPKPKAAAGDKDDMKVIVRDFSMTGAQLTPKVTLLQNANLAVVKVPDIHLIGIGEKEDGIVAEEAVAQIMGAVLQKFNETANGSGFLEGMSLEMLNDIGVSTGEVFKKNLKKSYQKEVDKFKQGIGDLKNMFE